MGEGESGMRVAHRTFWLPKAGHGEAEYEDAADVQADGALPFRAAVADGATESAFAGAWARQLAQALVRAPINDAATFAARLPGWQKDWAKAAHSQAAELPWYAAAKMEEGAFAALVGLALHPGGRWHALAVGDCCLFQLRKGETVGRPWPVETSEAFGNHPALVPSLPGRPSPPADGRQGHWQPGDAFLLATDALAAWLMETDVAAALAFTPDVFRQTVQHARAARRLRNDDVTLVTLEIERGG